MILIGDIESNSLTIDKNLTVHCIVLMDFETKEIFSYPPDKLVQGLEHIQRADKIVMHNYIGYDREVLKCKYPKLELPAFDDTLIMSRLLDPNRGSHSIENYGVECGIPKPVHEEWDKYSEEMLIRCQDDVRILDYTYNKLLNRSKSGEWDEAIALEYGVAIAHQEQLKRGVLIDREKAEALVVELDGVIDELAVAIKKDLPLRLVRGREVTRIWTKKGALHKCVEKYELPNICGTFSRISFEEYNLNSHTQLKDFLLTQGWKPTTWNWKLDENNKRVKTSPKLTEDSLPSIQGDIGKRIIKHSSLTSRRDFIKNRKDPEGKGLISFIDDEGRVMANANTLGTPTSRYTHVAPVANVPSSNAEYGTEVRSCFCTKEPYVMLGADFEGIEMRVAGHFAFPYDKGKLIELVLHGDFHEEQAKNVYHCSRKHGKGATYGIMYGCKAPLLSSYLGVSMRDAKYILDTFWTFNVGLGILKDKLEQAYKKSKSIRGLDGRRIHIRGEHKLLNSLIQSTAAILFKRWLINVREAILMGGYDAHIVIAYHDELQVECHKECVEEVKLILEQEADKLQSIYNLHVPIVAKVDIGMNWGETH